MSLIDFSGKASGKASSRNDLLSGKREKKNPGSVGGIKAFNLALWYVNFAAASGLLGSGNEVPRVRLQSCMAD
jgi:hypothetical protein